MKFPSVRENGICIIRVEDNRIDAAGAIDFKEGIRGQLGDWPGRVMLDLTLVEFIDSSGLGAVVAVRKMLGAGRNLELCGLTPAVEKVFRLTRMDRVFDIHPKRPEPMRDAV